MLASAGWPQLVFSLIGAVAGLCGAAEVDEVAGAAGEVARAVGEAKGVAGWQQGWGRGSSSSMHVR